MQGRLSAVMVTSHDHQHKAQSFAVMCFFFCSCSKTCTRLAVCILFALMLSRPHMPHGLIVIHWNTILLPVQLQCTRRICLLNKWSLWTKNLMDGHRRWSIDFQEKTWHSCFPHIYKESSNYWSLGFHFCPHCFCCWLKWRRGSAQQNLLIIYWRNTHISAKMELVAHVFYKFMMCNLTSLVFCWMFPCETECIISATSLKCSNSDTF